MRKEQNLKIKIICIYRMAFMALIISCIGVGCTQDEETNKTPIIAPTDALVKNSGLLTTNWNPQEGFYFDLAIKISNSGALKPFLSGPVELKIPYTTWETGEAETKSLQIITQLSLSDNQLIIRSTIPITIGTIATLSSTTLPIKATLILNDYVKQGQLIEQDETVRLSNKPFIVNNPNGYYKEVIETAPENRTVVKPYSNLSTAYAQDAENSIRDLLRNRIGLSEERTNLFMSKLNSVEFNEATENNYQLKAIALGMAAADHTNATFDALVGNVKPRIYLTLTNPSQGLAETRVVTINNQQAFKIFFLNSYFATGDPLVTLPIAFGNERLEMGNLLFQTSKREQIAQAIITNYLWLKILNGLPLIDAKALFEQTNPLNKGNNMDLATQTGSSASLSRRLPEIYKTQLSGNLKSLFSDTSYIARVKRGYGSLNDNTITPVEEPIKTFIINEFEANINQFPLVFNDEFIEKLQRAIDAKNKKEKRWNRFYQLAKLDPNLD